MLLFQGLAEIRVSHPREEAQWQAGLMADRQMRQGGEHLQISQLTPSCKGKAQTSQLHVWGNILSLSAKEPSIDSRHRSACTQRERRKERRPRYDRKPSFCFVMCLACHYEASARLPRCHMLNRSSTSHGDLLNVCSH